MDGAIQFSLGAVAWTITLLKLRKVRENAGRRADRNSFNTWLSTLVVSIAITFFTPAFSTRFDAITLNNLSRLIAYIAVSLSLYFSTISTLDTYRNSSSLNLRRWLKPTLIGTITVTSIVYALYIHRIPEWVNHHKPENFPEVLFMFPLLAFALSQCSIIARACHRQIRQEQVPITRFRLRTIFIATFTGVIYFSVKILLVFGYFWPPLGSEEIITLSNVLLVFGGLFWAIAYLNRRIYLNILRPIRGMISWSTFRDLAIILNSINRLCPSIAILDINPNPWTFARNPDYHLYRALIRILDGKTLLSDYLTSGERTAQPKWWDENLVLEAEQVNRLLGTVVVEDDFWEMVQAYAQAGKRYGQSQQLAMTEAVA